MDRGAHQRLAGKLSTLGRAIRPLAHNLWRVLSYRLLHDRLTEGCAIASSNKWANQVPTASGFCRSEDRGRRLDLVYESTDSTFVFYELKVSPASGDFIHAA